jgi:hypothetical protein
VAFHLHAHLVMHFGAAVREVLSASCGSDLRHASACTVVPALSAQATLQLLAANLEAAFGVRIPDSDLAHLHTVRDVLQCVRLHRWVARIEAPHPGGEAEPAAAGERPEVFRLTRRQGTAPSADQPPPRPPAKRL